MWLRAHLCDVSTTERPSRATDSKLFQRNLRALGSMPVVGSSCKAGADPEPGGTPGSAPRSAQNLPTSKPKHRSVRPHMKRPCPNKPLSCTGTVPKASSDPTSPRQVPPRARLHSPERPRLGPQPEPGPSPASSCCLHCRYPRVGRHSWKDPGAPGRRALPAEVCGGEGRCERGRSHTERDEAKVSTAQ